jgi:VCBS repeat-containing protein
MKKLFLSLIGLIFISSISFGQVICPTPVTAFSFTFSKPVVNNQKIGGASVCEPDAGQTDTWSISAGNTSNLWKIDANGNILVNDATLVNNGTSPFNITIKVIDNGTPPLFSTATVTMTDVNTPPTMSNQTFTIVENTINGTVVGTVAATDPDVNQTKTFSILSGNTNSAFSINATTGAIVVTNTSALNFEVTPVFTLVVKVQDNGTGNLSAQATITINVTNVNEVPVIVDQTFQ